MIALLLALTLFQADFGEAKRAYQANNYVGACSIFEAALAEPSAPQGPILYNLGNCAYRLGHHAKAVLHYRCARLRLPRDQEVKFNLRLAEQSLGIEASARDSFAAGVLELVDFFTATELLLLAAGLKTIGLLGLVFLRTHRAACAATAFLLVLGLCAGARLTKTQWFPGPPEGIVLAPTIELRPEPHGQVKSILKLRAGEEVQVEEFSDRWIRVSHERGAGWTKRSGVGVVE